MFRAGNSGHHRVILKLHKKKELR